MSDFVEINCATGEVTYTPLTPEQDAARLAADEVQNRLAAEQEAQRAADLNLISQRAVDDPAYASLVRVLGIQS